MLDALFPTDALATVTARLRAALQSRGHSVAVLTSQGGGVPAHPLSLVARLLLHPLADEENRTTEDRSGLTVKVDLNDMGEVVRILVSWREAESTVVRFGIRPEDFDYQGIATDVGFVVEMATGSNADL